MPKGTFVKALVKGVAVVESGHEASSGGEVRLTSACVRHV